ncbi:MAG: acyltransferase [Bacteroidota bacterium]
MIERNFSVPAGHKNNFDFLRLIFSILVVYTHGYVIYYGAGIFFKKEPLLFLTGNQCSFGTLAVDFFFIISGYLVLQSLSNSKTYFSFIKKRVLRIHPGFIAAYVFGIFLVIPFSNGIPAGGWRYVIEYWKAVDIGYFTYTAVTLNFPDWIPGIFIPSTNPSDLNTSMWTIPYEFSCYIFLMVLGLFRVFKLHRSIPLILFLVVLIMNIIQHAVTLKMIAPLPFTDVIASYFRPETVKKFLTMQNFALFFLAGSCFYYYRNSIPSSKKLFTFCILMLTVGMFWTEFFEIFVAVFGTYLLFYFAFSKRIKLTNAAKYGDLSYGIYLYGWPVQQLVMVYLGDKLNFWGSLGVSFLFIIPLAFASWYLVEKPVLVLKNKSFDFGIYNRVAQTFKKLS